MGVGVAGLGRCRDFRPDRLKRTGACGDHGLRHCMSSTDTPGLRNLLCSGPQVKVRATRDRRAQDQSIITRDSQGGTTHEVASHCRRTRRRVAAALFSPALRADDYPTKPITIITAFGPGSASDTIARVIAQPLGVALKQSVIVESAPGANGAIAAMYVARAAGRRLHAADDHQLAALRRAVPDEEHRLRSGEGLRAGHAHRQLHADAGASIPSIPAKNVKELIAYGKANPGKLSFASGNSAGIVAGETLKHWAEIDMLHVPYKSTPPARHRPDRRPGVDDVRRPHHRHRRTCRPARCARWR